MKIKAIGAILAAVMTLSLAPVAMAEDTTVAATVTVDENKIVREADREVLGISTGSDISTSLFVSGTTQFTPDFYEAYDKLYNIPQIRYVLPQDPMSSIGPMSQRTGNTLIWEDDVDTKTGSSTPTMFGPVEVIKMGYEKNPDCEFIFCVKVQSDPEMIADFVQFLSDEPSESEFGRLRASYGIEKPVNFILELGNEQDYSWRTTWVYEEAVGKAYCKYARNIIDAVRARTPDCRIMACGKTAPWADLSTWRKWNELLAKEIGADVDYVSMHLYYWGNPITMMNELENQTIEDFRTISGNEDIRIVATEHAKYPNGGPNVGTDMRTLTGVLTTSLYIDSVYKDDLVYAADYHTFTSHGNLWAMFDYQNFTVQGLSYMYDLWDKNLGDRIVAHEVSGESEFVDPTNPNYRFSATVSADGDKDLSVIMTNFNSKNEVDVKFDFKNDYTLVEEIVFTAPEMTSWNTPENGNVFTTTSTEKNEANFDSYTMPTKSVVVLKLKGTKRIPMLGEVVADTSVGGDDDELGEYTGEEMLLDISDSWAESVIMALYDEGIVTGDDNAMFKPQNNVTRAEFSTMIAKAMNLRTDYKASEFIDVSESDWFYPYVTSLYVMGVIDGDGASFNPYRNINFEEAAAIVSRAFKIRSKAASSKQIKVKFANSDVSDWAIPELNFAASNGLFDKFYENNSLNTKAKLTREQTAWLVYRLNRAINR